VWRRPSARDRSLSRSCIRYSTSRSWEAEDAAGPPVARGREASAWAGDDLGDGLDKSIGLDRLENDPARRRAAIDEIFTEDCAFYEPRGVYRGRDEIDRVAGAIKATHPDFRYQPIAGPEELGNGGRIQWVSGRAGEAPAYAGTDFIIARDGRIAALYLFFDKLP